MTAYLCGSPFQTALDNPVTAYCQLVQQHAKDAADKRADAKIACTDSLNLMYSYQKCPSYTR